jgi:hypothetical protein
VVGQTSGATRMRTREMPRSESISGPFEFRDKDLTTGPLHLSGITHFIEPYIVQGI